MSPAPVLLGHVPFSRRLEKLGPGLIPSLGIVERFFGMVFKAGSHGLMEDAAVQHQDLLRSGLAFGIRCYPLVQGSSGTT